ncbi:MAG TPA: hypothetical protein VN673_12350 [Clostridia bacterium]|nr:hypothetical protein [Clostridia bacterium]
MKLVRATDKQWVFRLGKREKAQLIKLLKLYPRVPPGHQRLTRTGTPDEENERLLEEALQEQRELNRRQVNAFVEDKARFQPDERWVLLRLSPVEFEWLLQVLNDVRVGSWLCLGAPEELIPVMVPNEKIALDLWAMELCGYFQASLLREREQASEPDADA